MQEIYQNTPWKKEVMKLKRETLVGLLFLASCLQPASIKPKLAAPAQRKLEEMAEERAHLPEQNTNLQEDIYASLCPQGMAKVENFCIDQFEGTLVHTKTEEPWSPYKNPGKTINDLKAVSRLGVVPQAYITGEQAAIACQNAEKRLCADSEWLQACAGSEERKFPYGNQEISGQCNYGRMHPDVRTAEKPAAKYELTDSEVNKVYDLASTGKYNQCVTPEGIYDLTGNLQEWVDDGNPAIPNKLGGGYYGAPLCSGGVCVIQEPAKDNRGCGFQIVGHPITHWDYSVGFRCCKNIEH